MNIVPALTLGFMVLSIFTSILSIVAMVKVIQIAEDVRHERRKEDETARKCRPYWVPVVISLVFAVLLVALLVVYAAYSPSIDTLIGGNEKGRVVYPASLTLLEPITIALYH